MTTRRRTPRRGRSHLWRANLEITNRQAETGLSRIRQPSPSWRIVYRTVVGESNGTGSVREHVIDLEVAVAVTGVRYARPVWRPDRVAVVRGVMREVQPRPSSCRHDRDLSIAVQVHEDNGITVWRPVRT